MSHNALWNRAFFEQRKNKWKRISESGIVKDRLFELINKSNLKRICDLGCGPGLTIQSIIREYPNIDITGLDISHDAIQMCKENSFLSSADFHTIDIQNFDKFNHQLIYELNTFRHLDNWRNILKRVLKYCNTFFSFDIFSNGSLILSDKYIDYFDPKKRKMIKGRSYDAAIPMDDFRNILNEHFEFVEEIIVERLENDLIRKMIFIGSNKKNDIRSISIDKNVIDNELKSINMKSGVISTNTDFCMLKNKFIVIIPCRYAETYIENAIMSVINQNYDDIGIICIDDNSHDNTGATMKKILEEKADKIPYIVYRNTSRKFALKNIDFAIKNFVYNDDAIIGLLDGDDLLLGTDAIAKIVNEYEKNESDIIWTQYISSMTGKLGICKEVSTDCDIWKGRNYGSSHFKTFRVSIYNNLDTRLFKFQGHWFERAYDRALMLALMAKSKRWKFIDEPLYRLNNSPKRYHHQGNLCNRREYREHLDQRKFNIVNHRNIKLLYLVNLKNWILYYEAKEIQKFLKIYRPDWEMDIKTFKEFNISDIDKYDIVHTSMYKPISDILKDRFDDRIVAGIHSFASIECQKTTSIANKDILNKLKCFGNITTINNGIHKILMKEIKEIGESSLTYIGVDVDDFHRPKFIKPFVNDDHLTVSWCGIPDPKYSQSTKGFQSIILPAQKILEKEGIQFNFAFGKRKNGQWITDLTRSEMVNKFYHQTDIILCTSEREGNPNPILEGGCCGVIPVTTNVGVTRDIIKHGYNGYFIDRSIQSLVKTILNINKNKDMLYEMKNKIIDTVTTKRNWHKAIHAWIDFWEESMAVQTN